MQPPWAHRGNQNESARQNFCCFVAGESTSHQNYHQPSAHPSAAGVPQQQPHRCPKLGPNTPPTCPKEGRWRAASRAPGHTGHTEDVGGKAPRTAAPPKSTETPPNSPGGGCCHAKYRYMPAFRGPLLRQPSLEVAATRRHATGDHRGVGPMRIERASHVVVHANRTRNTRNWRAPGRLWWAFGRWQVRCEGVSQVMGTYPSIAHRSSPTELNFWLVSVLSGL